MICLKHSLDLGLELRCRLCQEEEQRPVEVDLQLTLAAIRGYVDAEKAAGHGPGHVIAIPFTLAEWEALAKQSPPQKHTSTKET